jgi:hypothetical protein
LPVDGHHDWEHVVVWIQNNNAEYVSVSQHKGHEVRRRDQVPEHR